jgi:hypothetical protein
LLCFGASSLSHIPTKQVTMNTKFSSKTKFKELKLQIN